MEKISVSIVEDNPEIRRGLQRILNGSDGFSCLSVHGDAEDAMIQLPVLQPRMVIMDINLPGIDGIHCIRTLKEKCPDMEFVMFTIYEDSEQVFEALAAGAGGYLLKKTRPDKLLEALQELYEGGAPMSAGIARKVVHSFQRREQEGSKAFPAANKDFQALSTREQEVLLLLSKGFFYKEIASQLGIATATVKQHIHRIYDKLHVANRTEAINKVYGTPPDKPL
jgi:DNA-binding NarL/FixJ family response regulator